MRMVEAVLVAGIAPEAAHKLAGGRFQAPTHHATHSHIPAVPHAGVSVTLQAGFYPQTG